MTGIEHVTALFESGGNTDAWRTVTSRAYYVTFRRLMPICHARGFIQNKKPEPGERYLGVHRRLSNFMLQTGDPVLVAIARKRLGDLFSLRVTADYTFGAVLTRSQAQEAVRLAQDIHDWIEEADIGVPARPHFA